MQGLDTYYWGLGPSLNNGVLGMAVLGMAVMKWRKCTSHLWRSEINKRQCKGSSVKENVSLEEVFFFFFTQWNKWHLSEKTPRGELDPLGGSMS